MAGAQFVVAERGDLAVPLTARHIFFVIKKNEKKRSKHYASLQPTGAAGHTAC